MLTWNDDDDDGDYDDRDDDDGGGGAGGVFIANVTLEPAGGSYLPDNKLCMNAQEKFKWKSWTVSINHQGTASVNVWGDARLHEDYHEDGRQATVSNGDTITILAGKPPGYDWPGWEYGVKVTCSEGAEDEVEGEVFFIMHNIDWPSNPIGRSGSPSHYRTVCLENNYVKVRMSEESPCISFCQWADSGQPHTWDAYSTVDSENIEYTTGISTRGDFDIFTIPLHASDGIDGKIWLDCDIEYTAGYFARGHTTSKGTQVTIGPTFGNVVGFGIASFNIGASNELLAGGIGFQYDGTVTTAHLAEQYRTMLPAYQGLPMEWDDLLDISHNVSFDDGARIYLSVGTSAWRDRPSGHYASAVSVVLPTFRIRNPEYRIEISNEE